jgi:hypothetical protein
VPLPKSHLRRIFDQEYDFVHYGFSMEYLASSSPKLADFACPKPAKAGRSPNPQKR